MKKFQLSPENLAALQGSDKDILITYDIFVILEKVKNIHNECKILMQSGLQTLALGTMEQMTLYQVDIFFYINVYLLILNNYRKVL